MEIRAYIVWLTGNCEMVDLGRPMPFPIHDVDDWMVLRTAIVGEVDVLCSNDRDLRHPDLKPIYKQASIEILTDVELMARL